jgi:hypothetical protein
MTSIVAIDTRILQLESHMQDDSDRVQLLALKRERNALTSICRAPDDIISRILTEMIVKPSQTPFSFLELDTFTITLEWVRFTLACSRIRLVALGTCEIWSYIDCYKPPAWIELCLQRAGNSPLKFLNCGGRFNATVHLDLSARLHAYQAALAAHYVDTPTLHTRFVIHTLIRHQEATITHATAYLSDPFLVSHGGRIKQLSLSYSVIDGDTPIFPSLTHLCLDHIKIFEHNFIHLLRIIRNAALIEVLVIKFTDLHLTPPMNVGRKIRLPHLRVLEIHADLPMVHALRNTLPDPAELLSILVEEGELYRPLGIPAMAEDLGTVSMAKILMGVQEFWTAKTGRTLLPYSLFMDQLPARILFGSPPIDSRSESPGAHLNMPCDIKAGDPMLEHIHTLYLSLDRDEDDAESHWFYALSLEDHLPNVQHIVLGCMEPWSAESAPLESWLSRRHQKGRTLENLTFKYTQTDTEAWACDLKSKGIVKQFFGPFNVHRLL